MLGEMRAAILEILEGTERVFYSSLETIEDLLRKVWFLVWAENQIS
jgi:hypothetical protein